MKALDLFCGGGGAALGIIKAGFDVTGIDNNPKHEKVYPGTFICGDALAPAVDLKSFDLIWASPPCQRFTTLGAVDFNWSPSDGDLRRHKPNLIPHTVSLLQGHPYSVIENVPNAPIRPDIVLTGPMFGLERILRRRHFQVSFTPPEHTPILRRTCHEKERLTITQSMCEPTMFYIRKKYGLPGCIPLAEAREAMGISIAMSRSQVGEAIPPAYSKFICDAAKRAGCGT